MSNTLSATFGYGIVVPNGEDDEFEFDTSEGSYLAAYEDDGYGIDWWAALEGLADKLNLHHEGAYLHDYDCGSVLFADPLLEGFGTRNTFQSLPVISEIQTRALEVAADTLGIPFEPTWVLVASYG